jgi:predicted RNase H-like HicB family nuclease
MEKKATQKHHFPILIEQDEDNIYIVSCPVFQGCHTFGKTIDEAMKNIHEVIEMYLEDEQPTSHNHFIGFREIEMQIAV